MPDERTRPSFIVSAKDVAEESERYPGSEEALSLGRALGRAAGLEKLGVHLERLPPGRRTSYPHAEGDLEEFVYVLEGGIDLWVDGELHRMNQGISPPFPRVPESRTRLLTTAQRPRCSSWGESAPGQEPGCITP